MAVAVTSKLLCVIAALLSLGPVSAVKAGSTQQGDSIGLVRRARSQMTTDNNSSDFIEAVTAEKVQVVLSADGSMPDAFHDVANHTITQAVTWNIFSDINERWSGSCDDVCSELGSTCVQVELDNLGFSSSNTKPDAVKNAYERATGGTVSCNTWNTGCASGDNCVGWGLPFIHNNHFSDNICWGGDKVAPCNQKPVDTWHRRLCPCVETTETKLANTKFCMHKHYCYGLVEDRDWDFKCKCIIGVALEEAIPEECAVWHNCLNDPSQSDAFMARTLDVLYRLKFPYKMGVSSTSSLQQEGAQQDRVLDAPGCFHPDSSSQEELECDCWESIRAECNHLSGDPHYKCIRKLLCASPDICHSWKQPDDQTSVGQCTLAEISASTTASLAVGGNRKAERAVFGDIFQGRRQAPANISLMDPAAMVLEKSLSGKSCSRSAR